MIKSLEKTPISHLMSSCKNQQACNTPTLTQIYPQGLWSLWCIWICLCSPSLWQLVHIEILKISLLIALIVKWITLHASKIYCKKCSYNHFPQDSNCFLKKTILSSSITIVFHLKSNFFNYHYHENSNFVIFNYCSISYI